MDQKALFVSIFWYKRSFYGPFVLSKNEESVFHEVRKWLESTDALSIGFSQLVVDPNGIVYLAGFEPPASTEIPGEPLMTKIRDRFDVFCDHPNARHTPKRPLDILLPIGRLAEHPLISSI
jgi:hypothetical protein